MARTAPAQGSSTLLITPSDNPATMDLLARVAGIVRAAGLPDFQQLPAALQFLGQVVSIQANTLAFHDGFLVVTLIFLIALLPTWLLHRAQRGH